jgi:DNA-directed RNA polymerase specialized sigma24 family protein
MDTLSTLREMRDLRQHVEERLAALSRTRDSLVREASGSGFTQQQIATAAGLSQSRVQEVIVQGGEG